MIEFRCPNCARTLQMPEEAAGKVSQCPGCRTMFGAAGIAAGEPGPRPNPLISSETAVDQDLLDEVDLRERDAAILAERRRFLRQIEAENLDDDSSIPRWNASKRGAKIGALLGLAASLATLTLPSRMDGCDYFTMVVLSVATGAIIGFAYMHLRHTEQIGAPAWVPRAALTVFGLSFIVILLLKREPIFDALSLLGVPWVAFASMACAWLCFLIIAKIIGLVRK